VSTARGARAWLLATLLAPPSGLALAQAGAECVPGGTQEQVNACAVRAFQAADTATGVLYGDVMRALSATERPQLRREHSAWMQQRNAACKQATRAFEQQADGPHRYHECLTDRTQQRRQGLMRWLRQDGPAAP
jgi:uncharacterized protein YecT (DUF1311 family)